MASSSADAAGPTIPVVRETLRRRRVRLGRLVEILTAAADADLRARALPRRARLRRLGHLRRFVRDFADHRGLPPGPAVRRHLRRLVEERELPVPYAAERARAVDLLYRRVAGRSGPDVPPTTPRSWLPAPERPLSRPFPKA